MEEYERRIKANELMIDKHQREAIEKLQERFQDIQGYTPSKSSVFSKWLGMGQPAVVPKGLYIHGAVGGGKTMLMDLFHDVVDTEKKKRVHFNSFMLDVHRRIHALKNKFVQGTGGRRANAYDPIPPVASSITEECWLICFDEFQVIKTLLL